MRPLDLQVNMNASHELSRIEGLRHHQDSIHTAQLAREALSDARKAAETTPKTPESESATLNPEQQSRAGSDQHHSDSHHNAPEEKASDNPVQDGHIDIMA